MPLVGSWPSHSTGAPAPSTCPCITNTSFLATSLLTQPSMHPTQPCVCLVRFCIELALVGARGAPRGEAPRYRISRHSRVFFLPQVQLAEWWRLRSALTCISERDTVKATSGRETAARGARGQRGGRGTWRQTQGAEEALVVNASCAPFEAAVRAGRGCRGGRLARPAGHGRGTRVTCGRCHTEGLGQGTTSHAEGLGQHWFQQRAVHHNIPCQGHCIRHGTAWYGKVRHGTARYGKVRQGTART